MTAIRQSQLILIYITWYNTFYLEASMKDTYFCSYCQKDLPSSDFYIWIYTEEEMMKSTSKARRKWRRSDFCKSCSNESQKTEVNHLRQKKRRLLRKTVDKLKYWSERSCSQCKKRAKDNNLPFNIDPEFLLELWNNQNGLCYYTSEPLVIADNRPKRNSISIDRLSPELGYTKDNLVLTTFRVNTMKQELTEINFYKFCSLVLSKARDRNMEL